MGRRGKRKEICICLLSGLLCVLFVCAPINLFAAQTGRFLQSCEPAEGEIKIYCTDFFDEQVISPERFTAALGSQEVAVTALSTVGQEDAPVTVYCLIDVSGSMDEEQMAQAKAVLSSVCGGLKENDNMVIGSLGNDLSVSDFLTDQNEIRAVIDSLSSGHEDTNLYKGIVTSMQTLSESSKANRKKCLLILSDGEDDQKSGITQNEAETAVRSSSIPVYTVATLKSSQTDEEIASAKLLGSFARMSAGGRDYAPAIDGAEAAAVGEDMLSGLRNGIVLKLDTSQVAADNKDTLLLRVVYTSEDQSVIEDTMEIYTEDLVFAAQNTEEPVPETEASAEIEPMPEPKQEKEFPWMIAAGAAAAAGIVIILLAVVFIKKKKNKEQAEEIEEAEAFDAEGAREADMSVKPAVREENTPSPQKRTQPMHAVRFTAIGYENICFVLQMEEGRTMTIGRDKRADLVLNPKDRRLSGVHCKVQCDGSTLRIWDVGSTNGTFVGGVSLKKIGTAVLEEGQSVRMGSYEYRIAFVN